MNSRQELPQLARHPHSSWPRTAPLPAQPVLTGPSSYTHTQSPFRYIANGADDLSEKDLTPLTDVSSRRVTPPHRLPSSRSPSRSPTPTPCSRQPSRSHGPPAPLLVPRRAPLSFPNRLSYVERLKPWFPILLYAGTSLGFLAAIAFWKTEVFYGLDALSHQLQTDPITGYAIMFLLIFITTFPPLPLYSTFITLSGYTFGAWTGAAISYLAALSGAICVYILSRTFFRDIIACWLAKTTTIKRVVRAIEKRPKLLFMVRLAPYPYNVMNALLAASPMLTFKTYTVCTALSLFKVIIHTTIGASIHSFAGFNLHKGEGEDGTALQKEEPHTLGRVSAGVGITLCLLIMIYISWIARKAVGDELDDDEPDHDAEEAQVFLGPTGDDDEDLERGMAESPFSTRALETVASGRLIDDPHSARGRQEREEPLEIRKL